MEVTHYPRTFVEWGISVTLVRTNDGMIYFPVKQLCDELGIDSHRQLSNLRSDPQYADALEDLPVPARDGKTYRSVCLRRKETAWWLTNLDDARCKAHIRGHIREVKQALMEASDRIFFSDIDREQPGERGILVLSTRSEYILACLDCGARHHIVIVNGEPIVTLEREG